MSRASLVFLASDLSIMVDLDFCDCARDLSFLRKLNNETGP